MCKSYVIRCMRINLLLLVFLGDFSCGNVTFWLLYLFLKKYIYNFWGSTWLFWFKKKACAISQAIPNSSPYFLSSCSSIKYLFIGIGVFFYLHCRLCLGFIIFAFHVLWLYPVMILVTTVINHPFLILL